MKNPNDSKSEVPIQLHSYSETELIDIILKGKENIEIDTFNGAQIILTGNANPGNLTTLLEEILSHYSDEELTKIIESEDDHFGKQTITIVETILIDRGFQIQTEGQEELQENLTSEKILNNDIAPEFLDRNNPTNIKEANYRKFYTLTEINTYKDQELKNLDTTIPSGTMTSYHREIVRNGRNLLKIKGTNGTYSFTEITKSNLNLCQIYQVKNNHTDILLTSFEDYDKYKFTSKVTRKKILRTNENEIFGNISVREEGAYVTTFSQSEKDGKKFTQTNKITFNSAIANQLKLATLEEYSIFYATENVKPIHATKIKLLDGTEAIILNDLKNHDDFKEIDSLLQSIFFKTFTALAILLVVIPIILIALETGWFVFIGLIFIPAAIFLASLVTIPLLLIIESIIKRF
jgi:Type IV secretory pathway, VirB6 components